MRIFRSLLDVEAAAKVRKCVLVPNTVAISGGRVTDQTPFQTAICAHPVALGRLALCCVVAACQGFGRCAQTIAFCSALNALPTVWRMQERPRLLGTHTALSWQPLPASLGPIRTQAEQEQNTENNEVDLVLDDELVRAGARSAHARCCCSPPPM